MKHIILISCLTFLINLIGCDKLPQNGDLDGMWQVTEISYNSQNGQYDSIVNKKAEQIYWLFQLDLMAIRSKVEGQDNLSDNIRARFKHTGNTLDIYEIYYHEWGITDSLITNPNTTEYVRYGIKGNKAHFKIEKLDADHMRLQSDYAIISFRKF